MRPVGGGRGGYQGGDMARTKKRRASRELCDSSRRRAASCRSTFWKRWRWGRRGGWLERLPGVGPKTSAAVLLFSRLRMPAMPVDSHHHRVAARLGLIPESVGTGRGARSIARAPARRLVGAGALRPPRGFDVSRAEVLFFTKTQRANAVRCCQCVLTVRSEWGDEKA